MSLDLTDVCRAVFGSGGRAELMPLTCGDALPALSGLVVVFEQAAVVLGHNTWRLSGWERKLEPVCTGFEATLVAMANICESRAPTVGASPLLVRTELLDSLLDWFQAIDAVLDGVWSMPGIATWARVTAGVSVETAYTRAQAIQSFGWLRTATLLTDALGTLRWYAELMFIATLVGLVVISGSWLLLGRYAQFLAIVEEQTKRKVVDEKEAACEVEMETNDAKSDRPSAAARCPPAGAAANVALV